MIKKGIDLLMVSSSLLWKNVQCVPWDKDRLEVRCCKVCSSASVWLCHLVCKYRNATYDELMERGD